MGSPKNMATWKVIPVLIGDRSLELPNTIDKKSFMREMLERLKLWWREEGWKGNSVTNYFKHDYTVLILDCCEATTQYAHMQIWNCNGKTV